MMQFEIIFFNNETERIEKEYIGSTFALLHILYEH